MAAIIRRHRFTIIIIICFSVLMFSSWHFNRIEKDLSDSTPVSIINENFKNVIQISLSNGQHFFDTTEKSNNKEEEQLQFVYTSKFSEYEDTGPFLFRDFSTNIEKETTEYKNEEYFISIERKTDEFTIKNNKDLEETPTFIIGIMNAPAKPTIHPETNLFTSYKSGIVTDTEYLYLEQLPFDFEDQNEEWAQAQHLTYSRTNDETNMIDILNINQYNELNKQKFTSLESDIPNTGQNHALLINTPGCKIPKLDPWDPTVRDLIKFPDPYVCRGLPIFLKSNPGGSITFNTTILETYYNITSEELVCYYRPVYRKHEEEGSVREESYMYGDVQKLEFGIPLNEDCVNVSCNINGKNYEQHFALVPLKEPVEIERNSLLDSSPKLNVILLGIDSVSKLNFLRHFPRTHSFLNEKLKPFEMNGYTKVGDNTFPNLIPMLTGQFVEYWWNETVMDTMFFDDIGLIWKEFAKRGYRTFFAEDMPLAGTFNYLKRGFYDPPTDYYYRPMALALDDWRINSGQTQQFCYNSQLDWDAIYDYLKVYAQTMDTRPFFGFAMLATITHDDLNYAGWADEPTERLLDGLYSSGALDNTLLVLFSDHGLRFGEIRQTYVGKFEERLPLMYIHVPKWFLDKYPEIAKNLQINQDRLMTLFDIHATMLHLLDLNRTQEENSMLTLGRSIFEEISPFRTCDEANIQPHFCPCQTFDSVANSTPEAINAAQAIVDNINSKLQPYGVCEVLEVDKIMDARVGKASDLFLKYLRTENEVINKTIYVGDEGTRLDDYLITLITEPGGAVFEGSVRHNSDDDIYDVLGISRISMYGKTSWCIDSQKMKIFCYCKIQHLN